MSDELDVRMREVAQALVQDPPPPPPWPEPQHEMAVLTRSPSSSRRALVALLVVVVAALATFVLSRLVTDDSTADRHVPAVTNSSEPALGAPVDEQIFGVRSSPDGRHLLVIFSGIGGYGDPSCSASYAAKTIETDSTIDVELLEDRVHDDGTCVHGPQQLTVSLERPLRGRDVRLHGVPAKVFDGARLVAPASLPRGWQLQAQRASVALEPPSTPPFWSWVFSKPRAESVSGQCTPGVAALELHQSAVSDGASEKSSQALIQVSRQQLARAPRIGGATGSYYTGPGGASLVWQQHDQVFALFTLSTCDDDTLPTFGTMLRFARSLEPPPTGR